jgi:hypothetical protein
VFRETHRGAVDVRRIGNVQVKPPPDATEGENLNDLQGLKFRCTFSRMAALGLHLCSERQTRRPGGQIVIVAAFRSSTASMGFGYIKR